MPLELVFDWAWLPKLAQGLLVTIELTAMSIAIGAFLGLLLAIGRVYGRGIIYSLSSVYVQVFRGTPLLVQVMLAFFGLPSLGIYLSPFACGLLALSMNSSAFQAEYFRGAIQSIKAGQTEAARAIGMTSWQQIRYVVVPQTLRLVLPSWSNEVVYVLKASSIVYLISLPDLLGMGRTIASKTFRYFEILSIVALMYLALVLIFTFVTRWVEKRLRIPGLGTGTSGLQD